MFTNTYLLGSNQQCPVHNIITSTVDNVNTTLLLKQPLKPLHFSLLKKLTFSIMDITMIDSLDNHLRFTLIHNFFRLGDKSRLFVEKNLRLMQPAFTASHIYASAIALEREVYDLFGTFFVDHSDLRRILTDYSFVGYPLRKDFPLMGFVELVYSHINKSIISKPVQLAQEYRQMDYLLSWKNLEKNLNNVA